MKNNKKIILCILLVTLLGIFYIISFFFNKETIEADTIVEENVVAEVKETVERIKIDIKGAIKNPGVYEVSDDARVMDVINLAGGLKKNANTDYLNLAKLVEDEMIIWIYTDNEIKKFEESNIKYEYVEKECNCPDVSNSACIDTSDSKIDGKVNINTATLEELMTLTGIGESKALSIIEYREKTPFTSIEDIKNVSGIGDSAFEKIKDNITI